jgi:hypothetical protein
LTKNKSEKKQKNQATAANAAAHTPDDLIKLKKEKEAKPRT